MKTLLALFAFLLVAACAQHKELPVEAEKKEGNPSTLVSDKNGTIGVIQQATTKEGCPYTIRIKELSYLLDPINLSDEFKVDGLRVRFDYRPLRRANRCKEANPVEVVSMVKM